MDRGVGYPGRANHAHEHGQCGHRSRWRHPIFDRATGPIEQQNIDLDDFGPLLPVVAETYDGWLNDILDSTSHTKWSRMPSIALRKQFEEGNVGGGTSMTCYSWKGGIGTSSRMAKFYKCLAPASWCAGSAIKRPCEPVPVTHAPEGHRPDAKRRVHRSAARLPTRPRPAPLWRPTHPLVFAACRHRPVIVFLHPCAGDP